jgi:REP element-mobilizing transposase RayT
VVTGGQNNSSIIVWNDTDIPLAILITFRCRGTWLHGDTRGSVDRFNNEFTAPTIPPNKPWERHNFEQLKGEPFRLNGRARELVRQAIVETCELRIWRLYEVNVRTNHTHAVVGAGAIAASKVLHALKANATRYLRQNGEWPYSYSPWSDKGSNRLLWNDKSVGLACDYVKFGQGDDLPDFV